MYLWRPAPIYDGIANNRSDIELTLSRTSDVIRKNSAPIVKVVGDLIGDKPDGGEAREVYKLKQGGDVGLVSPAVSHDAIQYYISQLKENIEEDTQMPNLSMTNVKSLGNIGADARKTLLADAHMKVGEEKDDIIWAFDRECNIIKAFLAEAKNEWRDGIKRLKVSHHITPFVQRPGRENFRTDRSNRGKAGYVSTDCGRTSRRGQRRRRRNETTQRGTAGRNRVLACCRRI